MTLEIDDVPETPESEEKLTEKLLAEENENPKEINLVGQKRSWVEVLRLGLQTVSSPLELKRRNWAQS